VGEGVPMNALRLVFIVLRLLIVVVFVVVFSPFILGFLLICWLTDTTSDDGGESEGQRRSRIGR
jgi:hypothetical protein